MSLVHGPVPLAGGVRLPVREPRNVPTPIGALDGVGEGVAPGSVGNGVGVGDGVAVGAAVGSVTTPSPTNVDSVTVCFGPVWTGNFHFTTTSTRL